MSNYDAKWKEVSRGTHIIPRRREKSYREINDILGAFTLCLEPCQTFFFMSFTVMNNSEREIKRSLFYC